MNMTDDSASYVSRATLARLEAEGLAVMGGQVESEACLTDRMMALAASLGTVIPGRDGALIEAVVPSTMVDARPGSLSSQVGLQPLPLHTETAHWTTPCRYLILGCMDPGPMPTPTVLLDSRKVSVSAEEALAMRSAVFAIKNGRHSFFGALQERDRPFLRVDVACMQPISQDGAEVLALFALDRNKPLIQSHHWRAGDILLIDNWRMLHGRGESGITQRGRHLIRGMVQ